MLSDLRNLKLIFQIKKFDLNDLVLYTNDQKLAYDAVIDNNTIILNAKIQLPANLRIESHGKNLTLTEFWLGNIKASTSMLNKICLVTYANNKTVCSTSLLIAGTMIIEIYSRSFIEYHLMNKNLGIYEYHKI